jgi:hypothetical protein
MRFAAEQRDLAESIAELREIVGGRDDSLAEAAGIEAGILVHLAINSRRPRVGRRRNVDHGLRSRRQTDGL